MSEDLYDFDYINNGLPAGSPQNSSLVPSFNTSSQISQPDTPTKEKKKKSKKKKKKKKNSKNSINNDTDNEIEEKPPTISETVESSNIEQNSPSNSNLNSSLNSSLNSPVNSSSESDNIDNSHEAAQTKENYNDLSSTNNEENIVTNDSNLLTSESNNNNSYNGVYYPHDVPFVHSDGDTIPDQSELGGGEYNNNDNFVGQEEYNQYLQEDYNQSAQEQYNPEGYYAQENYYDHTYEENNADYTQENQEYNHEEHNGYTEENHEEYNHEEHNGYPYSDVNHTEYTGENQAENQNSLPYGEELNKNLPKMEEFDQFLFPGELPQDTNTNGNGYSYEGTYTDIAANQGIYTEEYYRLNYDEELFSKLFLEHFGYFKSPKETNEDYLNRMEPYLSVDRYTLDESIKNLKANIQDYSGLENNTRSFLLSHWVPPNIDLAEKNRINNRFRQGKENFFSVDLAKCSDLDIGTRSYFIFLKIYAWVFFILTVLSIPQLYFASVGEGVSYHQRDAMGLYATTIGNIGSNSKTNPECLTADAPCETFFDNIFTLRDISLLFVSLEFVQILVLFISVLILKRYTVNTKVNRTDLSATQYSIMITDIHPSISDIELVNHFSNLYDLSKTDFMNRSPILGTSPSSPTSDVYVSKLSTQIRYNNICDGTWVNDIIMHKKIGKTINAYNSEQKLLDDLYHYRAKLQAFGPFSTHYYRNNLKKFNETEIKLRSIDKAVTNISTKKTKLKLIPMEELVENFGYNYSPTNKNNNLEDQFVDIETTNFDDKPQENKNIKKPTKKKFIVNNTENIYFYIDAPTSTAFLTFEYNESFVRCLDDYTTYQTFPFNLFYPKSLKINGKHKIHVQQAPEPDGIMWENLELSKLDSFFYRMRTLFASIVVLIICLIFMMVLSGQKDAFSKEIPTTTTCNYQLPAFIGDSYHRAVTPVTSSKITDKNLRLPDSKIVRPDYLDLNYLDDYCEQFQSDSFFSIYSELDSDQLFSIDTNTSLGGVGISGPTIFNYHFSACTFKCPRWDYPYRCPCMNLEKKNECETPYCSNDQNVYQESNCQYPVYTSDKEWIYENDLTCKYDIPVRNAYGIDPILTNTILYPFSSTFSQIASSKISSETFSISTPISSRNSSRRLINDKKFQQLKFLEEEEKKLIINYNSTSQISSYSVIVEKNTDCYQVNLKQSAQCYCMDVLTELISAATSYSEIEESFKDNKNVKICTSFIEDFLLVTGLTYLIIFINTCILFALKYVLYFLCKTEYHRSIDAFHGSYMLKVFFADYAVMIVFPLIVFGSAPDKGQFLEDVKLMDGEYPDFNHNWYAFVGSYLLTGFIAQVASFVIIDFGTIYIYKPLMFWYTHFFFDKKEYKNTNIVRQVELNKLLEDYEFDITTNFGSALTFLGFGITFSCGLPILSPLLCFIFILLIYWHSYLVCNHFKKPPFFGTYIVHLVIKIIPYIIFIRMGLSIWMLGNPNLFKVTLSDLKNKSDNDINPSDDYYVDDEDSVLPFQQIGSENYYQFLINISEFFDFLPERIFAPHSFPITVLLVVFVAYTLITFLFDQLSLSSVMGLFINLIKSLKKCCICFAKINPVLSHNDLTQENMHLFIHPYQLSKKTNKKRFQTSKISEPYAKIVTKLNEIPTSWIGMLTYSNRVKLNNIEKSVGWRMEKIQIDEFGYIKFMKDNFVQEINIIDEENGKDELDNSLPNNISFKPRGANKHTRKIIPVDKIMDELDNRSDNDYYALVKRFDNFVPYQPGIELYGHRFLSAQKHQLMTTFEIMSSLRTATYNFEYAKQYKLAANGIINTIHSINERSPSPSPKNLRNKTENKHF